MPRTSFFPFWVAAAILLSPGSCFAQVPAKEPGAAARVRPQSQSAPPNILVFMVDTLRADALGCYGNEKIRTPHIDAFAAESTVFRQACTTVPATRPAIASLMTGVSADVHGIFGHSDYLDGTVAGLPRLAERLKARGYHTAALVANPNVDRVFGFARGFDSYVGLYAARHGTRPAASQDLVSDAAAVVSRTMADLDDLSGREPWFLFVLAIDPHAPYTPPAPFDRIYNPALAGARLGRMSPLLDFDRRLAAGEHPSPRAIRTLYDGEVSYLDREFGRLLAWMRRTGRLRNTLVVLTADHGEEFAEHGSRGHGKTVYEETTRVPLILRHPKFFGPAVRGEAVDLLDLGATLLAVAGATRPDHWVGRDLRAPLRPRPVISSNHLPKYALTAIRSGHLKGIENGRTGSFEIFDLQRDPGEKVPLEGAARKRALALLRPLLAGYRAQVDRFRAMMARGARPVEKEAVPEAIEKTLESLGYVGGKQ
ncbi:MAG: sulfatase [Acidobacteriota bacterium]|nr:sulfatase [Acidobacteriota bacterium]MDQ7086505.1 sulfatase [Acidobacteriota bacterium]